MKNRWIAGWLAGCTNWSIDGRLDFLIIAPTIITFSPKSVSLKSTVLSLMSSLGLPYRGSIAIRPSVWTSFFNTHNDLMRIAGCLKD